MFTGKSEKNVGSVSRIRQSVPRATHKTSLCGNNVDLFCLERTRTRTIVQVFFPFLLIFFVFCCSLVVPTPQQPHRISTSTKHASLVFPRYFLREHNLEKGNPSDRNFDFCLGGAEMTTLPCGLRAAGEAAFRVLMRTSLGNSILDMRGLGEKSQMVAVQQASPMSCSGILATRRATPCSTSYISADLSLVRSVQS